MKPTREWSTLELLIAVTLLMFGTSAVIGVLLSPGVLGK
jgi:hypothetical protein